MLAAASEHHQADKALRELHAYGLTALGADVEGLRPAQASAVVATCAERCRRNPPSPS